MKTTLRIEGMHCDGCAERIRRILEREPGVREADVSLDRERARVTHRETAVDAARIIELVEVAGFTASPEDDGS